VFGIVYGIVRGNEAGWGSPEILGTLIGGVVFLGLFLWWESRAAHPMLPLHFFRNRGLNVANAASVCLYFGLFGAVFFLAQFLQTVQGDSPLEAGLKVLPWTIMPMFIAPLAGAFSDRIGARPFMVAGLFIILGLAGLATWQLAPAAPWPLEHETVFQARATSYHSLVADALPEELVATAWALRADGSLNPTVTRVPGLIAASALPPIHHGAPSSSSSSTTTRSGWRRRPIPSSRAGPTARIRCSATW
jgi:MFS family permease